MISSYNKKATYYHIAFLSTPFILVGFLGLSIFYDSQYWVEFFTTLNLVYSIVFAIVGARFAIRFIGDRETIKASPVKTNFTVLFVLYVVFAVLYLQNFLLRPLLGSKLFFGSDPSVPNTLIIMFVSLTVFMLMVLLFWMVDKLKKGYPPE